MLDTYTSYKVVAGNIPRALKALADDPAVAREVSYYNDNISNIQSVDAFLEDDRLYRFALRAFGLSDMSYAKGLMRKVLESDLSDTSSFANVFSDNRYRELTTAFNFSRYGEFATTFASATTQTVERYTRQVLEERSGASNEGVRLMLYFERKSADLETGYDIISDAALLKVAQVALNLSPSMIAMPLDKLSTYLEEKIDIASLKDKAGLDKFIQRFSVFHDLNERQNAPSIPSIQIGSNATGLSANLMLSIAKIQTGS